MSIQDPREVRELRVQLAQVRRTARGVKESWRHLRAIPKSRALAAITATATARHDSRFPPPDEDDTHRL